MPSHHAGTITRGLARCDAQTTFSKKNVAFTQHSTLNGLLMSIKSEFSKDFAGEDGGKFEGDLVDHLFHYHLLAIDDVDALLRF